jgi:hypothetical protein
MTELSEPLHQVSAYESPGARYQDPALVAWSGKNALHLHIPTRLNSSKLDCSHDIIKRHDG